VIWRVSPVDKHAVDEYLLHITCKKCNASVVDKVCITYEGTTKRRVKNANACLSKAKILYPVSFIEQPATFGSWYLNYTDKGKVLKCYSNLSALPVSFELWYDNLV